MISKDAYLFFAKVERTPICWLWTAALGRRGHGIFGVDRSGVRSSTSAHRWSYEYHVGPIPDGYEIDHLCRVPRCVNPDHLEAVTASENMRRAYRAKALMGARQVAIHLDWPGFIGEFSSVARTKGEAA